MNDRDRLDSSDFLAQMGLRKAAENNSGFDITVTDLRSELCALRKLVNGGEPLVCGTLANENKEHERAKGDSKDTAGNEPEVGFRFGGFESRQGGGLP